MSTLEKAIEIAILAHKGQKDKAGNPYILHPLRVMMCGKTNIEKICGVLHDVIEDSEWTFEMLENEGFSQEIISVLHCVTKITENEKYEDFINRITQNKVAIEVKINDLMDNLDVTRLSEVTEKDMKRINKYLNALTKLKNINKYVLWQEKDLLMLKRKKKLKHN